ncbi:MAG: sulfatase [Pirellulaceae bacterium]|nr:sulfatase [Pirellulaceae bacterium]
MRILTSLFVLCLSVSAIAADKPNFVWLISEDNSIHYLKHYFPTGAETPRIVELASHGLTFQHAFSNAPVCSVARSTLITGCYAPRIGTQYHRRAVSVPMPAGLKMFPASLRDAGYYTSNNQKKDYNADETPGNWDASSGSASWRNRGEHQPFFYMQSFTTTHESSLHFDPSVMQTEKTKTDPQSVKLAPYHPDTPTFRYTLARYHDRIQQVDQQIGEVVDQLKADGLLENTFIFYFGDHGGVLPRGKGYAYESGLHVPLVIRIPEKYRSLSAWELGSRVDGFVSFIDFGPTLLNLAGVSVPTDLVDGRPFLGANVLAAAIDQQNSAFGYADRFDEKYDLVRTLRVGKFEYVRNYQPFNYDGLHNNYRYIMPAYQDWLAQFKAGKLNETQSAFFQARTAEALYDVEADPHEVNNLASNPKYADTLKSLRQQLQQRVKSMPDLSFYPESYLAETAFKNPVALGKQQQASIGALIDIADLSLLPWEKAAAGVRAALESNDPWQRYWGLIVCSSFGKQSTAMSDVATKLASNDSNLLVRVRAAEFLGLSGIADPQSNILQCLSQSRSGIELGLMLNSVVLLRDGQPGYAFEIDVDSLSPEAIKEESVQRRLEYLTGNSTAKNNKKRKGK